MSNNPLKVDEIFDEAVRLASGEARERFLAEACGDDIELRQRVDRLLQAVAEAGSFLESPAKDPSPTVDLPISKKPGAQIGPYKLLQLVGEGGMGSVWMAEQHEPVRRRVALKLIKPGMDSRQVLARFEAERQALSMMDHPNIAKVLDAGKTESGRPYFVMELVKGQPITQYCDEHHLNPRERLELFLPVCHAIQHAHQKGIIHRDIKPSNVLVAEYDGRPVAKVIDFGVAKAVHQPLTEKTMFTGLGQIIGTLEYMSPEQARVNQLDIDTRSDIYSLGVLLYELLTGSTPFDKKRMREAALDELLRIIREEEPPRPSTKLSSSQTLPSIAANRKTEPARLSTLVRGELDWIVMKALEKDRNRRYETANGFAMDIQRYLSDEAVLACPPNAGYRFRKFARKNKALLGATAAVGAALVIGLTGTVWQAVRATHAEDLAKARLITEAAARAEAEEARSKERSLREQADQKRVEADQARQEADAAKTVAEKESKRANNVIAIIKTLFSAKNPGSRDFRSADITLREFLDQVSEQLPVELGAEPEVEAEVRSILFRAAAGSGFVEGFSRGWENLSRAESLRDAVYPPDHPVHLETWINKVKFLHGNHASMDSMQEALDELLCRAQAVPDDDLRKLEAYSIWLTVNTFDTWGVKLLDREPPVLDGVIEGALRLAILRHDDFTLSGLIYLKASRDFRKLLRSDLDGEPLQNALTALEVQIEEGIAAAERLPRPIRAQADLKYLLANVKRMRGDFPAAARLEMERGELLVRWSWNSDFVAGDEVSLRRSASGDIPGDTAAALFWQGMEHLNAGRIVKFRSVVLALAELNDSAPTIENSPAGEHYFWVASLHPQAVDDWPALAARAERWVQSPKRYEAAFPLLDTGAIFLRAGNPRKALEYLHQGEKLFEEYEAACPQLAATYWRGVRWYGWVFMAYSYGQLGNRSEAIHWYSRYALDNTRVLWGEVTFASSQVSIRHAQSEVERALDLKPQELIGDEQDPRLHVARAKLFENRGDLPAAIEQISRAIDLDPSRAALWQVRGNWWNSTGNAGYALRDYTEAISRGGSRFDLYLARGKIYASQQQSRLALDDFRDALSSVHGPWEVHLVLSQRAKLLVELKQYNESLRDIEYGMAVAPAADRSELVSSLGKVQGPNGEDKRFRDAFLSLLNRSIELLSTPRPVDVYRLARSYLNRSLFYRTIGELDRAEVDFQKTLELDPSSSRAYFERSQFYVHQLKNYPAALADASKFIELESENPAGWVHRGNIYMIAGDPAAALADYDRGLALNPKHVDAVRGRANALQRLELARLRVMAANGNLASAEKELEGLLDVSPDPGKLLVLYGLELTRAGMLEQMQQAVRRSAEFGLSTESLMNYNLGCGYAMAGESERAFAAIRRAIELGEGRPNMMAKDADLISLREDPRFAELLAQMQWMKSFKEGKKKFQEGNFSAAIAQFTEAIELNPNFPLLYHWRGSAFQSAGRSDESAADFDRYLDFFQQAVSAEPENWVAWQRRAEALVNLQRWDEALADVTKALELAPDKPQLQQIRASCSLALERWDEAVSSLSQLLVLPRFAADWQMHYHRALARLALDDQAGYRAARGEMVRALQETKDPVAANFTAWTCALAPDAVSDWSVPLALARQAEAAQPDSPQNQNTLGFVLLRAGKIDEAVAALEAVANRVDSDLAASNNPLVYTWYALALAHHAAGHADAARDWYDRANSEATKVLSESQVGSSTLPWNRRLTLQFLQRDAESKISAESASVMTAD